MHHRYAVIVLVFDSKLSSKDPNMPATRRNRFSPNPESFSQAFPHSFELAKNCVGITPLRHLIAEGEMEQQKRLFDESKKEQHPSQYNPVSQTYGGRRDGTLLQLA